MADYNRGRELHEDGLMSKGDLDALRETFELARIARQQAHDNQDLTRSGRVTGGDTEVETIIRTTASGTVLSRAVNVGDPVVPLTSYQPGTELAAVADMGDLIFKGTVDEIDVGKITIGMPCRIKVGALPDDVVTGRLSRIAPQAQKAEGATLFDVEIELDPNQEVTLRAGYSANADVVIREKTDIVLIPERLVLFEDDKTFVEFPGAGPEAEPQKVEVELGLSDGLNVEIVSGVADGDRIVQRPPREIS
jgi:HlyD family secretion protein